MKLVKLNSGSKHLPEIIEKLQAASPKTFIIAYIDPTDGEATFSEDGYDIKMQLGLWSMVNFGLYEHRGD